MTWCSSSGCVRGCGRSRRPSATSNTSNASRALGLFAEESPFTDASSAVVAAARIGLKMGRERLEHALSHDSAPHENGWSLTYHAFDYNLDWFEIGTIDDDR